MPPGETLQSTLPTAMSVNWVHGTVALCVLDATLVVSDKATR